MTNPTKSLSIYIEGNIGTGKTTFLKWLEKTPEFKESIVYEPVDEWLTLKDESGSNILDKFYQDQYRWSFTFQINSFISRLHKEAQNKSSTKLVERSVFTDRICFAKTCYESHKMTSMEYDIYTRWHDWLCGKFKVNPSGYIYLRTDPKISYQRIKNRNRDEESSIPIEYLEKLHTIHDEWLLSIKDIPVLVIDVSEDIPYGKGKSEITDNIYKEILSFIERIKDTP